MDWPRIPVERLQNFQPPFCPRRDCSEHLRHGSYEGSTTRMLESLLDLTDTRRSLELVGGSPPPGSGPNPAPAFPEPATRAQRLAAVRDGRRLNAILERFFLAAVWRNFVKRVSERRARSKTPAMKLGLTDEPWSFKRLLSRRLFPDREKLAGMALALYRRELITPVLPSTTRHRLHFAY